MEERQVTVDRTTYTLEQPFMVIATQNPIEHEGTYPLPESQLDRFLMRVSVGYPDRRAEIDVLETHGDSDALGDLHPVVSSAEILSLVDAVRNVHVASSLKTYLVELADATRRHPYLMLGMSPRATLNLQRSARALAATEGRDFVLPDDIKRLAEPVLGHRLLVTPEGQLQGVRPSDIVRELLDAIPVPSGGREP
jgi:MoxR-like ATPase